MTPSTPQQVLIFSTAYYPFVGGAEVAVKEITDRIDGIEFYMITARMSRKAPKQERIGNVMVYRFGFGFGFDKYLVALFGYRFAHKLHKKNRFSLVWSIMASYNGFAAERFASKADVPLLLTLQEGDPIEYILKRVRLVRKLFDRIFKHAAGLQTISTYLMKWGMEMGFAGKISEVVPNGVDVNRFTKTYDTNDLIDAREQFGFPLDATILVTASRLVKKNGVADVVRALPQLPEGVCFVVCGSGGLEADVKSLTRTLGMEERVRFLGSVSHEVLPMILQSCDIFIRPSLTEGLGNAFLEAMAAGLPTVGTMVGGIPDFLEDGVTGFACEPKNPESIVHTVNKIMQLSEEKKKQVHAAAMDVIQDRYNWEYVSGRMQHIMNELCAS